MLRVACSLSHKNGDITIYQSVNFSVNRCIPKMTVPLHSSMVGILKALKLWCTDTVFCSQSTIKKMTSPSHRNSCLCMPLYIGIVIIMCRKMISSKIKHLITSLLQTCTLYITYKAEIGSRNRMNTLYQLL